MKFALCATLLLLNGFEHGVLSFAPSYSARSIRLSKPVIPQTYMSSSPSSNIGTDNSEESNDDEDDDFAAMQREIAMMIESTTTAPAEAATSVPVADIGKYNKLIAVASAVLGSFLFVFQHSQPVSGVALMHAMEKDSVDINVAVCNGKPTVIDFYADWCESCKVMAPSMRSIETQYKDKINFVTIDGSNAKNADLVKRFRVDGIPHLAFIGSNQEVKTALVGSVPRPVLKDQIVALLQGKPMPYEGYDAFEEESHFPLDDISKTCPVPQ